MDLYDLYQRQQIRKANQRLNFEVENNHHQHTRARDDRDDLHARIDRLLLVNEAMWLLLIEHLQLTDEDLLARIHDLDTSDGAADGRRQPRATDCSCGAKIGPKAKVCVYCGAPPPPRSVFDAI